jgi:hypothetical protein
MDAARVLLHYFLPQTPMMVRAWRMRVLHARDSAGGMLVRTMPSADVATRHRDGVRSRCM